MHACCGYADEEDTIATQAGVGSSHRFSYKQIKTQFHTYIIFRDSLHSKQVDSNLADCDSTKLL